MNDQNCFIIIIEKAENIIMTEIALRDVLSLENCFTFHEVELKQKWKQLLISNKIQKFTQGKLNWLIKNEYQWLNSLDQYCNKYANVFVFFVNSSFVFHRPPVEFMLEKKKKNKNLHYILFYWDVISRKICNYSNYLRKKGIFDLVYTFDKSDAEEYGLILWNTPYSTATDLEETSDDGWDLYYCGKVKNQERAEKLLQILEKGSCHISIHMDLTPNLEDDLEFTREYQQSVSLRDFGDYLPYLDVLQRTKRSNCILDICLTEQRGMTLRPYEAVVYSKKLLTTNPDIVNFKYYDARYMKYYHTVDDIDWEWVRRKENVDYHYQGDFSPKALLDDIEKKLSC